MLKQLMLQRKLEEQKKKLTEHQSLRSALETRRAEFDKRDKELETALNEITDESTAEEKETVEQAINDHTAEGEKLEADEKAYNDTETSLQEDIDNIEKDLKEIEEKTRSANIPVPSVKNERTGEKTTMNTRHKFFGMNLEQRSAFMNDESVKNFIGEIRSAFGKEKRGLNGGTLVVPTVMLDVIRENINEYSKLIKYFRLRQVKGKARQNVMGEIPEGVWTESVAAFNELDMSLNQVELDAFKIGGVICVPNSVLEDGEDIDIAYEVMSGLGAGIGKGLDRAGIYGTGRKMPLGIVTRLAQTSKPENYGENERPWEDLHTSNVIKINAKGDSGATFFGKLIDALSAAKPKGAIDKPFWVMNRKTHLDIMAKALAFNAAAALTAGINNEMPVIGGEIVELDDIMNDYEIGGGYGEHYLLAERSGANIKSSEHARIIQDETVFVGSARYDGKPVIAESFVFCSYDNSDVITSEDFPKDYANSDIGTLVVTSEAGTAVGDTAITVTGTEASGTTLRYRLAGQAVSVENGAKPIGFTSWDGSSDITATTGKTITVVELDGNGKAIKVGSCVVTAKAGT